VRNPLTPRALRVKSLFPRETSMDGVIYLVGLVVVVLAILSFFGLH